ncbi:MAG: hypothetical protein IT572_00560 [Deltaproteobacteria bacterium]|nr:hypothetical protein [Deltaproteobacteria bacterium]
MIYSLLGWLFLHASSAHAVTPAELANQAQADYQAGRYENAIRAWGELGEIGFHNGDLYYNIASAYWRLGKVGQARRYFLGARDWSPRDPDIRHNLAFLEAKVDKAPPAEGPRALLRKVPWYRLSLNASEALVLAALGSLGLFALLAAFRLRRKGIFALAAACCALPLLYGMFQFALRRPPDWLSEPALIVAPRVALRENPLPDAASREELKDGALVKLRKAQGDFALVKSASGKEGWVERSSLGEIP